LRPGVSGHRLDQPAAIFEHRFEAWATVLDMAAMAPHQSKQGIPTDGAAHYRPDGYGGRLVVLPATCRRRRHQLGATGYHATEGGGILRVRCDPCAAETTTDAAWILAISGPVANCAELDDAPYKALLLGC
jgi:hypothetical protein